MEKVEFGPLVIRQRLSPNEAKYFFKRFQNQPNKQNIDTDLPDLYQRALMDINDKDYNKILYPYIKNYLDVYGWQGGYKLQSLWANVYKGNDYIPPHTHVACDLSFVLFLKMPSIDKLKLSKSEGFIMFRYGEEPYFSQKVKPIVDQQILPKVGELIIFPQNLTHYSAPMSHPQAERISISGNISLN